MYLGFDWHQKMRLVLTGPNTPEVRGLESARVMPVGSAVVVGKIGLYIADVFDLPRESDAQQILTGGKHPNQQLFVEDLAKCEGCN